jgi:glycosyltransferase involved in cell wall biosynthesis
MINLRTMVRISSRVRTEFSNSMSRIVSYLRPIWRLRIRKSRRISNLEKIGYAVLTHERPNYLEDCLKSLFDSNLSDYQIDIFIIDDGSKDPEVLRIIERYRHKAFEVLLLNKADSGTAGEVINRALKIMQARNKYTLYGWSDPDAIYSEDWLPNTMSEAVKARCSKKNHRLGPFTSFNSNDIGHVRVDRQSFKRSLPEIEVREQAGMLNLFCTQSDLEVMGEFPKSTADEITICRRMRRRGLYFFSTKMSYIEHVGSNSNFESVRVNNNQNVSGLQLVKTGWPEVLEKYFTVGMYRDVRKPITWGNDVAKSCLEIEVMIPCAEKDISKLVFVIQGIRENLQHSISRIVVVGSAHTGMDLLLSQLNIEFVDETEVLSDIPRQVFINGMDRSRWMYQQFLKLEYVSNSESSKVLILDADTVFTTPQKYEIDGKDLILCIDEWHEPYHQMNMVLGMGVNHKLSAVCHSALMDVSVCKNMLKQLAQESDKSWRDCVLDALGKNPRLSFSEYQIYKDFMVLNHPDDFVIEYASNKSVSWNSSDLSELALIETKGLFRSISFHSWRER